MVSKNGGLTVTGCPQCGGNLFTLTVTQLVDVAFHGGDGHEVQDGPRGDMEWGDNTHAICRKCGHCAPLGEMTVPVGPNGEKFLDAHMHHLLPATLCALNDAGSALRQIVACSSDSDWLITVPSEGEADQVADIGFPDLASLFDRCSDRELTHLRLSKDGPQLPGLLFYGWIRSTETKEDVEICERSSLDEASQTNFKMPYLVIEDDGAVHEFPDELAACAAQRAWRVINGLDALSGVAAI